MSLHPTDRPTSSGGPGHPHNVSQSQERPRTGRCPPYKLILLHDANADLMFIIRTVMELTRLCRAEATHKMWEAHHSGRSVLLTTYKERAELYVEQFASKGLTVVIEPA